MEKKHKQGDSVKVEIWNSVKRKSEYYVATITKIISATDRDYRVNVVLGNGVEIDGCAPECILVT